jgi:integrase
MKRRGVGEGGLVRRKDGKWQASYVDLNGKRRYLYGAKRATVSERLAQALRDKALRLGDASPTVAEYMAAWLKRSDNIRAITKRRYEALIRLHVLPYLGAVELRKVQPSHLSDLYSSLRGKRAPATIAQLHAVLHSAFDEAMKWNLLARNPVGAVRAPKVERREMQIPTIPDVHRLLTAVQGDPLEALYVLAITTGARQGELLALRWQDIDLEARTMSISATLTRLDGKWKRVAPKTRTSVRTVPLSPQATAALRAHRRRMSEELMPLQARTEGETLVFLLRGAPINGYHLTERAFKPLLRRHGLPVIRFHDLRHVAASLMLSNGVPVHVVSRILGHSGPAITLNVYSHLIPGDMESAVQVLDRALGGVG